MVATHADTDKLRRLFEFAPTVSVDAGVEWLWNWWEEHSHSLDRDVVAAVARAGGPGGLRRPP